MNLILEVGVGATETWSGCASAFVSVAATSSRVSSKLEKFGSSFAAGSQDRTLSPNLEVHFELLLQQEALCGIFIEKLLVHLRPFRSVISTLA